VVYDVFEMKLAKLGRVQERLQCSRPFAENFSTVSYLNSPSWLCLKFGVSEFKYSRCSTHVETPKENCLKRSLLHYDPAKNAFWRQLSTPKIMAKLPQLPKPPHEMVLFSSCRGY